MTVLGLGATPVGMSLVGYGTPDSFNPVPVSVLMMADGTQGNSPLLAPVAGQPSRGSLDFVLDSSGQKVGARSVPMMVQLALFTARDSSILSDFGLDLSALTVLSAVAAQQATAAVRAALKSLIDRKLVSLLGCSLDRLPSRNGVSLSVRWIDLTSAEQSTTTLTFGAT